LKNHDGKNKVFLLKNVLYSFKESPRAWFRRFTKAIVSSGYKQSQGENTLFIKHFITCKLILLLVYVDDIIIATDDKVEKLAAQFEMKDLEKLKYFLGIERGYLFKKRDFRLKENMNWVETSKLGCRTS